MPTQCKVPAGEAIVKGDAVCVIGFDDANKRPIVKRATRANLITSKTVFGVAEDNPVTGILPVCVAGEVAGSGVTGLVTGSSRIVVTDFTNATETDQCKLKRIDDSNGNTVPPRSEMYVVGTCDENGNLIIQPRHASEETGFPRSFNVRAYGAMSDWSWRTGTIAAGTNILDVNIADDLHVGQNLLIGQNTGTFEITSISGNIVTLGSNVTEAATNENVAVDNLPYFQAALAAMTDRDGKTKTTAKLVADGHFYLSQTLEINQGIVLEGSGFAYAESRVPSRSSPGTWLVFPAGVTGIRIRSGGWIDNPNRTLNKNVFSGEKTCLRNLTISCKNDIPKIVPECQDEKMPCLPESDCIHGIYASVPVHIENVYVEKFLHDGIHIVGGECLKPVFIKNGIEVVDCTPPDCQPVLLEDGHPYRASDGNASGSYLENCSVASCGRDGIHFSGGDAQAGLISCCSSVKNRRAGFYDATFGNTYIGCHSAYNAPGPNYITELAVNASVFINCWSEGEVKNIFHGPVTIISGKIGGDPTYMTDDSLPFILESGLAQRAPLGYKNSQGPKAIRSSFGDFSVAPGAKKDENMVALSWGLLLEDGNSPDWNSTFVLRYFDKPDTAPNPRRDGWWVFVRGSATVSGENDMLRLPTKSANSRLQAPWFPNGIFIGDSDGGFTNVSFIGAKDIPTDNQRTYEQGDVIWNSEPSPGKPIGWVCMKSGTGTITSPPPVDTPAAFSTFGTVDSPSKSYPADHQILDLSDRYVTVIADSKTITLPASPIDGQTHSIKCKAGVAPTTVNTAGGLTIDGLLSVTLNSGDNATFRYSNAVGVGEWERR